MTTDRDKRNQLNYREKVGRKEEREKIAQNLQAMGMDAEFIEKALGKSETEDVKPQNDMTTERDRRNQEAFKMKQAREEGRAEGRTEGHQERNTEIAKSMLADGMPVEKVSQYTGLTKGEIEELGNLPV